jgi:hypothetical protein
LKICSKTNVFHLNFSPEKVIGGFSRDAGKIGHKKRVIG